MDAPRHETARVKHQMHEADPSAPDLHRIQVQHARHALNGVGFSSFRPVGLLGSGKDSATLQCEVDVPVWADRSAVAREGQGPSPGGRAGTLTVAVKAFHAHSTHASALNERQVMSRLPLHPNVLPLLASYKHPLTPAMIALLPPDKRVNLGKPNNPVMTLVMPLHALTLRCSVSTVPPPSVAELLSWSVDIAAALAHLWQFNMTHLDLKLDTISVNNEGRALLSDLSFAVPVAPDGRLGMSAARAMAGTVSEGAPEVVSQARILRLHTQDRAYEVHVHAGRLAVWVLGIVLHEVLGVACPGGAPAPRAANVPPLVMQLLARMVKHEPTERPSTPEEAYQQLRTCVQESLRAAPAPPQQIAPLATASRALGPAAVLAPAPVPAPAAVPSPATTPAVAPVATPSPPATPSPQATLLRDRTPSRMPADARPIAFETPMQLWGALLSSQRQLTMDPETGCPRPNAWGLALQAASQRLSDQPVVHAARMCMALLHHWGAGGMPRDPKLAKTLVQRSVKWCRREAKRDMPFAQWLVGQCYLLRWPTGAWFGALSDSDEQAVQWFERAAQQGHAGGAFSLGLCYERGQGVPADARRAVQLYLAAAEAGHPSAQFNLAHCYRSGAGVLPDMKAAVAWWRQAAAVGDADAQYELGRCFERGRGVRVNEQLQAKFFALAAEQGHAPAQRRLSECYVHGTGVEQDEEQADTWRCHASREEEEEEDGEGEAMEGEEDD